MYINLNKYNHNGKNKNKSKKTKSYIYKLSYLPRKLLSLINMINIYLSKLH